MKDLLLQAPDSQQSMKVENTDYDTVAAQATWRNI